MGFLFGGGRPKTQQAAVSGITLQSSAQGLPIPLLFGTTKLAPNLIWYGDFTATQTASTPQGGGKGGVGGGGGGKGGGGGGGYNYKAALMFGLCDGPVNSIGNLYVDKNITSLSSLGYSAFFGSYTQTAWGHLSTNHPTQAINYRGTAYIANAALDMGDSPHIPNHNVEVYGRYSNSVSGQVDADPSLVITYLLTDARAGAGFPASRLGNLATYQAYCIATGLLISPAYTQQSTAATLLKDIQDATNSAFVFSGGILSLVPYGDQSITANGYTYTAPSSPLYSLTDDDFIYQAGNDPIQMTRINAADAYNSIQLECLDRNNQYNPAVVGAKDQALIDIYGLRENTITAHLFANLTPGRLSAQLQLQRQAIRNQYAFTLDQRYILLDPMDIIAITDPKLGLSAQWVRIISIDEQEDGLLDIIAEEYLNGSGSAAAYSFENSSGYFADYNADPGVVNTPVLFEPPAQLSEALEVWLALSGGEIWGGADIYLSTDGETYKNIGRYTGKSRTGQLAGFLASYPEASRGQTIDQTNTLTVDLSESGGQLSSASTADASSLATLCYVDGELISYRDATLIGADKYDLGYLIRGAYGSTISAHTAPAPFARLDSSIFTFPYNQDQIGKTVYLKFCSFNQWGGALQNIADVQAYAFNIQGLALTTPLPQVTNLRATYVANITQLVWDEITDFRPVMYEIRKGTSWAGAQTMGRVAHPPFNVQGDDTYWVAAYSEPVPALSVYGDPPQSIDVFGSQITSNVIASWDEKATGWTGTLGGTAYVLGTAVVTGPTGDILSVADYLNYPDVLQYNTQGNGSYEIPASHQIAITNAVPCYVLITWKSRGQHINSNILDVPDYLNLPDLLDLAASAVTNVYPEIAMSQNNGSSWGAWQKYVAGQYVGNKYKARMQLETTDPTVQASLEEFSFSVDVPDRNDHYVNQAIASGGTTITFQPDGAASPKAFNGGPQGSPTKPNVQVTILGATQGDDVVLSALSLSSVTVQIVNGGSGVARNCNILVQGF